jgi:predicted dehydrogenase
LIFRHLIIGYGKWGKTVAKNIQKSRQFKISHIIKNRNSLNTLKLDGYQKLIDTAHVCSPIDSHYHYAKKLIFFKKNIIIEKPCFEYLYQIKSIINELKNKNNVILVNYINLFNNALIYIKKKIIKENEVTSLKIIYSKFSKSYLNKYDCIKDWLDHPLSISFFFLGSFNKFSINNFSSIKNKKNFFFENLNINFLYKKTDVSVYIRNSKKNENIRLIYLHTNKYYIEYDDTNKKLKIHNKINQKIKYISYKKDYPILNLYNNFYKKIIINKKYNNLILAKKLMKKSTEIMFAIKKIKN